jgi:hypothetical protein
MVVSATPVGFGRLVDRSQRPGLGLLSLITPGNSLDQYELFTLGFLPACATATVLALLMSRVPPAEPKM